MIGSRLWRPYTQMQTAPAPLEAVTTEGCRITLADGRVLIDGIASWWDGVPRLQSSGDCRRGFGAAGAHAACDVRRPHARAGGTAGGASFSVAAWRFGARVSSPICGSVAVEVAMKMAAQYWLNRGVRTRRRFLAFRGGYHGDTLGTMAVCDPEEGMHSLYSGLLADHAIVDLPCDDASRAAFDLFLEQHASSFAGILVEPLVQGAGGMIFHDPAVLRHLRASGGSFWFAVDTGRDIHRLRPHGHDVRVRSGRHRA